MLLKADKLTLSYNGKKIIDNFTAELQCNGITVITGESGCGKTTLLRIIAGLQKPDSGSVSGVMPEETAFLFQENRLLPWRTVLQHITDVLPKKRADEAEKYLELVELTDENNSYPDALSGGMARRLALARTLALGGKLYVLDEPFSGVDSDRRERIIERLSEMKLDILAVTHDDNVTGLAGKVYSFGSSPLHLLNNAE